MAAREIVNDAEYRLWVLTNRDGYVLNTDSDAMNGRAMLHRAHCEHIADHKSGKLAGSVSRKFVADTIAEMRALAKQLGRPLGNRWDNCSKCA
jgi:hypothetical protein